MAVALPCVGVSSTLAAPEPVAIASPANATMLRHDQLRDVSVGQRIDLDRFELPGDQRVNLDLHRFEVIAPGAQLVLGTADGQVPLERPDVVLLRGHVEGAPDSLAYLALSPFGTNGFIQHRGALYSIATGAFEQARDLEDALRVGDMATLINNADDPREACAFSDDNLELSPMGPMVEPQAVSARGSTCRIANIAIETDWEFTSRIFRGNANAAAAYAVTLMGAISEIYERDVNIKLAVGFLRVWDANTDPYDESFGDPLDLVRNHWRANMSDVERTTVHYLTGRTDVGYGGVAYLSVLCNDDYGYGVSAHLNGSFPYPLTDHSGGNWDVVVAAHELGHNFGTGHTHDSYNPVIDGCGNGDCGSAFGGTIMSYCHTCPGGLGNIVLQFHPRVQNVISAFLDDVENNGCDLTTSGVNAGDDFASTYEGSPIDVDVLANDAAQSCDPALIASYDTMTAGGGAVSRLAGAGPGGRDLLRYTPAPGFDGADTFNYTLTAGPSASVNIDVAELRDPDTVINPAVGLVVDYYALNSPSQLPNFDALTPYASDIATSVDAPSTSGEFMTSGRADEVGALLTGFVEVFADGLYTFYTNSDDGSALYIGDQLVVDNDGLHGMVERSGQIALHAGRHAVRIEFFENGGGAGLIASLEGPGLSKTDLISFFLSHETSTTCSEADLAEPFGVLDFSDVTAFLSAFSAGAPDADLAPPFGTLDFSDVLGFLGAFGAGCP
ncbi:MAG: M12 family metallo-peptidase [Phycisphaerales bacterium JB059]